MRLEGISTIEEANAFLPRYLDRHNKQFGKEPASPENAHRPLKEDLRRILCKRDKRKLSKELTFQHQGILYQIETKTPNRLRHVVVEVLCGEEGIEVEHAGEKLKFSKWDEKVYERPAVINNKELEVKTWFSKKRIKPGRYHPWR